MLQKQCINCKKLMLPQTQDEKFVKVSPRGKLDVAKLIKMGDGTFCKLPTTVIYYIIC